MGRTSSVEAPCRALTRDLSSAADMAQTTCSLRYVHGYSTFYSGLCENSVLRESDDTPETLCWTRMVVVTVAEGGPANSRHSRCISHHALASFGSVIARSNFPTGCNQKDVEGRRYIRRI